MNSARDSTCILNTAYVESLTLHVLCVQVESRLLFCLEMLIARKVGSPNLVLLAELYGLLLFCLESVCRANVLCLSSSVMKETKFFSERKTVRKPGIVSVKQELMYGFPTAACTVSLPPQNISAVLLFKLSWGEMLTTHPADFGVVSELPISKQHRNSTNLDAFWVWGWSNQNLKMRRLQQRKSQECGCMATLDGKRKWEMKSNRRSCKWRTPVAWASVRGHRITSNSEWPPVMHHPNRNPNPHWTRIFSNRCY